MANNLWYKSAVFYELHVRSFYDSNGDGKGDLRGIAEKMDYLKSLGIDCIWLLPIYSSPLRDDGYDISDYCNVHPDYGTLEDFKALVEAAHARDMHVIADLVVNHTSDEHEWFKQSRSSRDNPYRNYYIWSDTDQKYDGVRIIFLDVEKSNWAWDKKTGQFYWHRFFSSQPDLNFDNPAVQEEMFNIVRFWMKMGIDGFRVDAPPYLFEREGTSCESLPETHEYLKRMRKMVDAEFPDAILLAEANQWPHEVVDYFGNGDEFHMAFHFPLMPRIYMSMAQEDISSMVDVLARTPAIPASAQWATFLRNHDELTLEMVSDEERAFMRGYYAPEPRMNLNMGIRRRLSPLLNGDRRRIELVNSLLFTLVGSPIIYYGDEIGMGDDIWLHDRNGVRTPLQWDASQYAGFSSAQPWVSFPKGEYAPEKVNVAAQIADPGSLFHTMQHMISVRRGHPAFGSGDFAWVETGSKAVAAYLRQVEGERMLVLNNLSSSAQVVQLPAELRGEALDVLAQKPVQLAGSLTLAPFEYLWLKI